MRLPWAPMLAMCIICVLTDWRIYYLAVKRQGRMSGRIHLLLCALLYCILTISICLPRRSGGEDTLLTVMWLLFAFISVYAAKILYVAIDMVASLPELFHRKRMRWLSITGLILAAVLLAGEWWGALVNRFRIDIKEVEIPVVDLPDAFDGYRMVQFSDIHVGTFGTDTTFTARLVDRINSLNPDVILFTGDIVNRHSAELPPHLSPLSRLSAPDGVFSILGNHDYGDYYNWSDITAKEADRKWLHQMERHMGWTLLLDSTAYIHRTPSDSIAIIGVENIGDHPFPSYGSLKRALKDVNPAVTKILMSHNPAHWADSIETAPTDSLPIDLTLSGHTHAMQIEIAGLSPAAMRYRYWGGHYPAADGRRHLYVNIGAGTVGMPMRLGATPELTVITLRKADK